MIPRPSRVLVTNPDRQLPCHFSKTVLRIPSEAGRATFLACCRQGVCFIPLILVLPRVLGLVGVELCQPIADALTFFISLPFLLAFLRQLEQMDKAEASHAPAQL